MYLRNETKPVGQDAMIDYLKDHFRYNTMNSWNNSMSYAHCIKIHMFGLGELETSVYNMLDIPEALEEFSSILDEFGAMYNMTFQIAQNGRSGGYLVLIHGGKHSNGRIFAQPGQSLDMSADFNEWDLEEIEARVNLVWDFDVACENAVTSFIEFAKSHIIGEEEIAVMHTVKVAIPIA